MEGPPALCCRYYDSGCACTAQRTRCKATAPGKAICLAVGNEAKTTLITSPVSPLAQTRPAWCDLPHLPGLQARPRRSAGPTRSWALRPGEVLHGEEISETAWRREGTDPARRAPATTYSTHRRCLEENKRYVHTNTHPGQPPWSIMGILRQGAAHLRG